MDSETQPGPVTGRLADVPIPRVPEQLRQGPFTTAQAAALGVSRDTLRSLPWRRVLRDVYAHRALPDTRQLRFAAVALILPADATICGTTAAWLYGIDVHREDDLGIHISCPKGRRVRCREGVTVRQETLDPRDVVVLEGVRLTTPTRTAIDCARWLRGVEGVVVIDALAHAQLTDVGAVRDRLARLRGMRGGRAASMVMDLADPLAESPMETRLRVLFTQDGLPTLVSQHVVHDARGRFVGRLDLAWPRWRLAVEYDGSLHWQQRRADDRRRALLRELGWVVLVYSSEDYFHNPRTLLAEVTRHLNAAQRRTAA